MALLYEVLAFKIRVTLTLTFQSQSRSNLMVQWDSPYMVSHYHD